MKRNECGLDYEEKSYCSLINKVTLYERRHHQSNIYKILHKRSSELKLMQDPSSPPNRPPQSKIILPLFAIN